MKPICVTAQILTTNVWLTKVGDHYIVAPTGCWEWTGALDRYGYGKVFIDIGGRKRQTGAHRASWIAHRGPILANLELDHLCRNRRCINPFHLEPVTGAENTRRGEGIKGRKPRARKTCTEHGLDEGYWREEAGRPRWICRACQREWARRRYYAKKQAA